MTKETPMIIFDDIAKDFGDTRALEHLNLTINKGELFVLVGPSGSGKTTTLKMINGLHTITDGYIYINGKRQKDYNLQKLRWKIGYVLQQIALFPNMTVAQNIALIPEMIGLNKKTTQNKINELLEVVGLDPKLYRNRYPRELSGGEQQRIGILRALIFEPEIILMDEPFSALDPISKQQLQELVKKIHQERPLTTIVFVTHDMNEAIKLGDRIAVMKDGKVIEVQTPEKLLSNPEQEFTKRFFAGSQHKQVDGLLTKSLQELIRGHFLAQTNPLKNRPRAALKAEQTLRDAIVAFSHVEVIEVFENNKSAGFLTRQCLLEAEVKLDQ